MIYSANDRKTKTLHTKKAKNEKTIVNSHQTKKEGKKGNRQCHLSQSSKIL